MTTGFTLNVTKMLYIFTVTPEAKRLSIRRKREKSLEPYVNTQDKTDLRHLSFTHAHTLRLGGSFMGIYGRFSAMFY